MIILLRWTTSPHWAFAPQNDSGSLSGLLVTHLPDVRYLSGFTGSSAALAVTRRAARLFTDGRYTGQAAEEVNAAKVQIVSGAPAVSAVQWIAAQPGVEYAAFDPAKTTVAELAGWKAALPSPLRQGFLSPLPGPMVETLRQVKDEEELHLMSEAAKLGCELFENILGVIRPGMTEMEVAAELEYQARRAGAEAMSFETIVASGGRSALPAWKSHLCTAAAQRLPDSGLRCYPQGLLLRYDAYGVPGTAHRRRAERLSSCAGSTGGRHGCRGFRRTLC